MTARRQPLLLDLSRYLSPDRVLFLEAGLAKDVALRRLAEVIAAHPAVRDPAEFTAAIFEREEVSSTGIGGGIAVPHAKLSSVDGFVLAVGVSAEGIDFAAKDDRLVHLVVMIAASDVELAEYLKVLASVAARLKDAGVVEATRSATDPATVLAALS